MKYLTAGDVLLLHNIAIDEFGGSHGLRDLGLLESAVARPRMTFEGADLYPDIFLKGAALVHSLLLNHQFVDGNKRTAIFSVMVFLELNGYKFAAEQKEAVRIAMWIENKKPEVEEVAVWLRKHCRKS
ncbi:type II toxin-antitoxin system death-on-curing family toxin [Patescibacteria group bacterium]|nr:type II toxin-antitoxin system death-on-curing family toxin [Patescibacteria group bacterium]